MSWVASQQGGADSSSVPPDLDQITDEEFLKQLWQQADDFSDRRRIRARMYKLREKRLREMVQNDEESLGALTMTEEGDSTYQSAMTESEIQSSEGETSRRKSSVEVKLVTKSDSSVTDSSSRMAMRGVDLRRDGRLVPSDEEIIDDRIQEVSKGRGARYQQALSQYERGHEDSGVSISKSSYSIQSNALTGDSYQSMKHKEVRDSVSPVRGAYDRKVVGEDSENFFTSDEEVTYRTEGDSITSRKVSKEEKSTTRTCSSKAITERKTSKELEFSSTRRTDKTSPTSPTRRAPGETTTSRITTKKQTLSQRDSSSSPTKLSPDKKSPTQPGSRSPTSRKAKIDQIAQQMDRSLKNEYQRLDQYINENTDDDDEIINEEEEDVEDESGNTVKIIVQTRRKKDGTEIISRRVARSMKIVERESDIDEILVGNPDHEVIDRKVEEKEEKDGSKIKIITETRRRPDGIEYTTKNVLKTSKIFDYDHPEDISYNENDELISTEESTETDEHGITIRTVIETRRKKDGVEYTTKKVYKTSKVDSTITPSDDDEILDTEETEEKQSDGTVVKTVIEKRRTRNGQEYTHRQVYRSRKMTLSGIDVLKGMPSIDNDDEIIDRKEKEEFDESKTKVRIVTETRKRKDGSTYSFDYVLRSFKGTESDINKIPIQSSNASNINVSETDELIKEEVKEDKQKDGTIVRTIIERRRAKDGTEYLRHRIMKIPKLPEPQLVVGSLDDEVLEENVKEKVLEDGTHCKAITERRRSSLTGIQYTLRRMSKVYQHPAYVVQGTDEILDENLTEEEAGDGILVKTVIRRYQRPDGTVYTTHDIQKTYQNPVSVSVEGDENDELIDRSYDESETNDGFLIKTIMETRCRTDGTHYTVERIEKVSKMGDDVQVSFKGNSLSSGSPGDTVVSYEEHEEPVDDGTVVKTIIEVRRRRDGTEYTNKTTIKSTQVLVPEHETSYVIIKADSKGGETDSTLFPSLDDEVIYTRKKKEIDEKGNPIIVIIETRQSKSTGEKYNLTKKVHTTDVIATEQGEKVLARRTRPDVDSRKPKKPLNGTSPVGSVSVLKSKFSSSIKKDSPKPSTVTSTNKRTTYEETTTRTLTSPKASTPIRKTPRSPEKRGIDKPQNGEDSDLSANRLSRQPIKRSPNDESKPQPRKPGTLDLKDREKVRPKEVPSYRDKPSPSSSPRSSQDSKMKPPGRRSPETKKLERSSDSSPDRRSGSDSPGKESPRRVVKPRSNISSKREPDTKSKLLVEQVSSSPKRGRSPLRSGASTPRETTPSRPCCKRSPEEESPPSMKPKSIVSIIRRKPTDEKLKPNGDIRKYPTKLNKDSPKKMEPEKISRFDKPSTLRDFSRRIQPTTRSPKKKTSPTRDTDLKKPKKPLDKERDRMSPPECFPFVSKEPIVSLPQTPLTVEMKAYPASSSPFIQDVSSEPDLPYDGVYGPSLVRELSDYQGPETLIDGEPEQRRRPEPTMKDTTQPKKPTEKRPSDKKISDTSPSSSSEDDSRRFPKLRKDSPSGRYVPSTDKRRPSGETRRSIEKRPSRDTLNEMNDTDKKLNGYKPTKEGEPRYTSRSTPKVEKTRRNAPKSILDQLIPDGEKREVTNRYTPKTKEEPRKPVMETRTSITSKRSLFERTKETTEMEPFSKKGTFPVDNEKLVPVKEPLIVPKYIHPLGSSSESEDEGNENKKNTKLTTEEVKLSSTRLVMNAMGAEPKSRDKYPRELKDDEIPERDDTVSPLQERSKSPRSKDVSPHPRSKEGSPVPFVKEDSPGRFLTGKPIDQGPNTTKIKRLERSNSNKKIIYEDLEIIAANLPTYLKDIEYITDITVLETLLQKAETYEERRIIRGHIRSLKRTDTNINKPASQAPYKRFVDSTTPSKPSPTASPILTRRTTTHTVTSDTRYKVDTTIKAGEKSSSSTPIDDSRPTRKYSDQEDRPRRKHSSDDSGSSRRSSVDEPKSKRRPSEDEPQKYPRKPSAEEPQSKTLRTRKTSPDDTLKYRKTSLDDPKRYRKPSPDDTNKYRRPSPDTGKIQERYMKPSADDTKYRRPLPDDTSKYRRPSPDDTTRYRKTSPDDTTMDRKKSPDTLRYRKTSPDSTTKYRKPSDETIQVKRPTSKPTRDSSPEESKTTKKPSITSPIRKTSSGDVKPLRKTSSNRESLTKSPKEPTKPDTKKDTKEEPRKYTRRSPSDKIVPQRTPSDKSLLPKEPGMSDPKDKPSTPRTPRTFDKIPSKTTISKPAPKTKDTPSDTQPFVEPLRHQRTVTKTTQSQTNVDKIISPYGLGPTDENGVPLFGLKALKKKPQQPAEDKEPIQPDGKPEFVPSESHGRPSFGSRAVRMTPLETTTYTTSEVTKDSSTVRETLRTATVKTQYPHLTSPVTSQPTTHTTEVVRSTNPTTTEAVEESCPTDASSDDSHNTPSFKTAERKQRRTRRKELHASNGTSHASSEDENDASPHTPRRTNRYTSKREPHSDYSSELEVVRCISGQGETSPSLVKSVDSSLRRKSSASENEEEIEEKSVSLKDIIKLHESKVTTETNEIESPRVKPKKKLRDSFEPTNEPTESRPVRTWDLETDLTTRSDAVENIIAKHEILTQQESSKSERKLTSILKKTSTASVHSTKITSSDSERDDTVDRKDGRRKSSSERPKSPLEDDDEPVGKDSSKYERKTSYTEIKLSKSYPSDGDESKPLRTIKGKKPAEEKPTTLTKRTVTAEKTDRHLHRVTSETETTSHKTSSDEEIRRTLNRTTKSKPQQPVDLFEPQSNKREKSPSTKYDLFVVDDRKKKTTSLKESSKIYQSEKPTERKPKEEKQTLNKMHVNNRRVYDVERRTSEIKKRTSVSRTEEMHYEREDITETKVDTWKRVKDTSDSDSIDKDSIDEDKTKEKSSESETDNEIKPRHKTTVSKFPKKTTEKTVSPQTRIKDQTPKKKSVYQPTLKKQKDDLSKTKILKDTEPRIEKCSPFNEKRTRDIDFRNRPSNEVTKSTKPQDPTKRSLVREKPKRNYREEPRPQISREVSLKVDKHSPSKEAPKRELVRSSKPESEKTNKREPIRKDLNRRVPRRDIDKEKPRKEEPDSKTRGAEQPERRKPLTEPYARTPGRRELETGTYIKEKQRQERSVERNSQKEQPDRGKHENKQPYRRKPETEESIKQKPEKEKPDKRKPEKKESDMLRQDGRKPKNKEPERRKPERQEPDKRTRIPERKQPDEDLEPSRRTTVSEVTRINRFDLNVKRSYGDYDDKPKGTDKRRPERGEPEKRRPEREEPGRRRPEQEESDTKIPGRDSEEPDDDVEHPRTLIYGDVQVTKLDQTDIGTKRTYKYDDAVRTTVSYDTRRPEREEPKRGKPDREEEPDRLKPEKEEPCRRIPESEEPSKYKPEREEPDRRGPVTDVKQRPDHEELSKRIPEEEEPGRLKPRNEEPDRYKPENKEPERRRSEQEQSDRRKLGQDSDLPDENVEYKRSTAARVDMASIDIQRSYKKHDEKLKHKVIDDKKKTVHEEQGREKPEREEPGKRKPERKEQGKYKPEGEEPHRRQSEPEEPDTKKPERDNEEPDEAGEHPRTAIYRDIEVTRIEKIDVDTKRTYREYDDKPRTKISDNKRRPVCEEPERRKIEEPIRRRLEREEPVKGKLEKEPGQLKPESEKPVKRRPGKEEPGRRKQDCDSEEPDEDVKHPRTTVYRDIEVTQFDKAELDIKRTYGEYDDKSRTKVSDDRGRPDREEPERRRPGREEVEGRKLEKEEPAKRKPEEEPYRRKPEKEEVARLRPGAEEPIKRKPEREEPSKYKPESRHPDKQRPKQEKPGIKSDRDSEEPDEDKERPRTFLCKDIKITRLEKTDVDIERTYKEYGDKPRTKVLDDIRRHEEPERKPGRDEPDKHKPEREEPGRYKPENKEPDRRRPERQESGKPEGKEPDRRKPDPDSEEPDEDSKHPRTAFYRGIEITQLDKTEVDIKRTYREEQSSKRKTESEKSDKLKPERDEPGRRKPEGKEPGRRKLEEPDKPRTKVLDDIRRHEEPERKPGRDEPDKHKPEREEPGRYKPENKEPDRRRPERQESGKPEGKEPDRRKPDPDSEEPDEDSKHPRTAFYRGIEITQLDKTEVDIKRTYREEQSSKRKTESEKSDKLKPERDEPGRRKPEGKEPGRRKLEEPDTHKLEEPDRRKSDKVTVRRKPEREEPSIPESREPERKKQEQEADRRKPDRDSEEPDDDVPRRRPARDYDDKPRTKVMSDKRKPEEPDRRKPGREESDRLKPKEEEPGSRKPGEEPIRRKPEGEEAGRRKPEGEEAGRRKPEGEEPARRQPEGEKPDIRKPEGEGPAKHKEEEQPGTYKPGRVEPDKYEPERQEPDGRKPEREGPQPDKRKLDRDIEELDKDVEHSRTTIYRDSEVARHEKTRVDIRRTYREYDNKPRTKVPEDKQRSEREEPGRRKPEREERERSKPEKKEPVRTEGRESDKQRLEQESDGRKPDRDIEAPDKDVKHPRTTVYRGVEVTQLDKTEIDIQRTYREYDDKPRTKTPDDKRRPEREEPGKQKPEREEPGRPKSEKETVRCQYEEKTLAKRRPEKRIDTTKPDQDSEELDEDIEYTRTTVTRGDMTDTDIKRSYKEPFEKSRTKFSYDKGRPDREESEREKPDREETSRRKLEQEELGKRKPEKEEPGKKRQDRKESDKPDHDSKEKFDRPRLGKEEPRTRKLEEEKIDRRKAEKEVSDKQKPERGPGIEKPDEDEPGKKKPQGAEPGKRKPSLDKPFTVDGRIIDEKSPETPKKGVFPRTLPQKSPEEVPKRKSTPIWQSVFPVKGRGEDSSIGKRPARSGTSEKKPKRSMPSRFSKSPEPDDLSRRLRKLSKQRKTSAENISEPARRKTLDTKTYSLQSLSAASTTSSVPGYMRPRGESKSSRRHITPERDPLDLEEYLLNSYQYTRCTKRIVKPPVKYDYTYVINRNESPAGGGGSYSIYFGPRESAPSRKSSTAETPKYDDTTERRVQEESMEKLDSTRKSSSEVVSAVHKDVVKDSVTRAYTDEDYRRKPITESTVTSVDDDVKKDNTYLGIKQQYENTIKALDTKHNISRDETYVTPRKDYEDKSIPDVWKPSHEGYDTYSEIRQQYQDTVRNITEDSSYRKSSDIRSREHTENNFTERKDSTCRAGDVIYELNAKDTDIAAQKYRELISKDYKDYGIERSPISEVTKSDDDDVPLSDTRETYKARDSLRKADTAVTFKDTSHTYQSGISSSHSVNQRELQDVKAFETERDAQYVPYSLGTVDSKDFRNLVDKASLSAQDAHTTYECGKNAHQKYNYQVGKEEVVTNVYKFEDTSNKNEYISPSKEYYGKDQSPTVTINNKYIPDYDYNKVYLDKIEKSAGQRIWDESSRRDTSYVEHDSRTQTDEREKAQYEYRKQYREADTSRTSRHDNSSSYVTFDGRLVTPERKTYSTEYKMADPETRQVGQFVSAPSSEFQQDNGIQPQVEKISSATVGLDSNTAFPSTQASPSRTVRDETQSSYDVTRKEGRSFLDDRTKVTGISDVLLRMEASEAVDHEAKVTSDDQARSLLNKFLGAQVLMTGVESMMANASGTQTSSHTSMTCDGDGKMTVTRDLSGEQVTKTLKDGDITEDRKVFSTGPQAITYTTSSSSPKVEDADIVRGVNINEVTDDFALNQLLDSCEEYDERRRVRMRLKALMAEKKALQKQLSGHERGEPYSSSSRRTAGVSGSKGSDLHSSEGNSSYSFTRGSSKVTSQKSSYSSSYSTQSNSNKTYQTGKDGKGISPFDKFKQLDSSNPRQNQNAVGPAASGPLFQLSTSLIRSASGVKDMILSWCQNRTRDYQGVKIENFSTSWNDGMAFCALIHHFYPDAFDFNSLNPKNRRENFSLAFRVADEKAGVMPLLDVDDMVMMKKPDWKCVFTYVQSLYKRLKDE